MPEMGLIIIGSIALFVSLFLLPIWPFSAQWTVYPSGFFFLIGLVSFAVALIGRRETPIWRPKKTGLETRKPGKPR